MMMKKTGLLAVLTAGVLLFAGCGGEAKTIDAQALAKSLATEIKYDDTLKELTADEISMLVDLPEDVDSVMYAGSGSTAEEVGVLPQKIQIRQKKPWKMSRNILMIRRILSRIMCRKRQNGLEMRCWSRKISMWFCVCPGIRIRQKKL